jgi:multicomponent Na+:H+ antiporter subunit D
MSLGGIPPLSGFFAKFALIKEGLLLGQWAVTAAALAVGLLTLYSMVKIWNEAFWKNPPAGDRLPDKKVPVMMIAPAVLLALCTVCIGLFPGVFIDFSLRAADQLVDPSSYIKAVLDVNPAVSP